MFFCFLPPLPAARGRSPLAFLALAALLLVGFAAAAWAVNPTTALVSRGLNGGTAVTGDAAWGASVSADGRWVAFLSNAINLTAVPPSPINFQYVFAKNTVTGAVELVSVGVDGTQPNQPIWGLSLSADGRYVAFESAASNLVPGDTNGASDIFVRNLVAGTTTLASVGVGGAPADNSSSSPSLSADGRSVAFHSFAQNLVPSDTNSSGDIFVRDLVTGTTTLANVGVGGAQADFGSEEPSISADGRSVAFHSFARNLVAGDTNGKTDIFVRDLDTDTTTRASVGAGGVQATGDSFAPSLSADGRYVAFESTASNLVAGDTNGAKDIFVRDLSTGTTTRASVGVGGAQADRGSEGSAISADGRSVAFQSFARNLTSDDTELNNDIFVRDLSTGTTTLASVGAGGDQANIHNYSPSLSADGRYVAFESTASNLLPGRLERRADIFLRNLSAGATTRANVGPEGEEGGAPASSYGAAASADGRYLAFASNARNLVPGDTNNSPDVFVRDLSTGTTTPASLGAGGAQADGDSGDPSISADGRYLAFYSSASNLVPGDTNGASDIFVRNLSTGTTIRASVDSGGTQANNDSHAASISADGRFVAFNSRANNLVAGDTNSKRDIFVRDLSTGITTRASVGPGGAQANLDVLGAPSLSATGRYVAFHTIASNLVPGDTNGAMDVFVRDLVTGATTRASVDSGGTQANFGSESYGASLSADGRYAAFTSSAENLVPGDTNEQLDVFVRNLATGATTRVSVGPGGGEGASSYGASLSADGRYVAFASSAYNFVPGDRNGFADIFVRDLRAGATRVSVGPHGREANASCGAPAISANGQVVSYLSAATNLTDDVAYGAVNVFASTLPPLAPGAPTNLTAVAVTSRRVNLAWTDHTNNETGFQIWASLDGAPLRPVATSAANQTTYLHVGPEGNHTVRYQVRAVTAESQTDFSNVATAVLMAQPLGLVAKALDSTTIDLRWKDHATNEASYEVWRSVRGGPFSLLTTKNGGATQHTDTVPLGGETYTYKVCARNGAHVSSFSNQDSAITLRPPTNLATNADAGVQVDLTWTSSNPALTTGFQVYRRTSATGGRTLVGTTGASVTNFSDQSVQAGKTYWYEVRATANAGTDASSFSNLVSVLVPVAQPTGLTAQALNSTTINVRWTEHATNESNYELWRAVGDGAFTLLATLPPNATQHTDTVPRENAIYTYQVRARYGTEVSSFSNRDEAVSMKGPTQLTGFYWNSLETPLYWADNSDTLETGFEIYRRSSATGERTLVGLGPADREFYLDWVWSPNPPYWYEVRAVAGGDSSDFSNLAGPLTP